METSRSNNHGKRSFLCGPTWWWLKNNVENPESCLQAPIHFQAVFWIKRVNVMEGWKIKVSQKRSKTFRKWKLLANLRLQKGRLWIHTHLTEWGGLLFDETTDRTAASELFCLCSAQRAKSEQTENGTSIGLGWVMWLDTRTSRAQMTCTSWVQIWMQFHKRRENPDSAYWE